MSADVDQLLRWEESGGVWRVLARAGASLTVGLFTCDGGEEMSRLSSADTEVLAFVGDRMSSED